MAKIYVLHQTNPIPDDEYNRLLKLLPKEKQKDIGKKIFRKDREIILLAHSLLRKVLFEEYNLKESEYRFDTGKYGKPYLTKRPDIHFNISHTHKWAAVALSDHEIGVDIENHREIDPESLSSYFHPDENAYIRSFSKDMRIDAFFRIWTMKESYIKAIGLGLQQPLAEFSTIPIDSINGWKFSLYSVNGGTKLAVCQDAKEDSGLSIEFIPQY